ncbi:hypothetical protein ACH4FX_37380 [Streptomyces sp. NPDC018019]|uniref:hypothetical protein n=1 Tax=Streptomyces sp. NPDC018019 TaxID=3365030 RepID=UPI003790079B
MPPPSGRTVALVAGAVLVIIGAMIAALAVFGGSDGAPAPTPRPSQVPTPQPTRPTTEPTRPPWPRPSVEPTTPDGCKLYDMECQHQSGGASGGTVPVPSRPPEGGTVGTTAGGIVGGSG